ncbi:MAG: beta-N-acetylhexosaminidase [Aggregatilineales bacterium]
MLSNVPIATFTPTLETNMGDLIPMPVSVKPSGGTFKLNAGAAILVEPNSPEITKIGQYLADKLNPSTGFSIQVSTTTDVPSNGNIYLTTAGGDSTLGEEGYQLTVTPDLVTLIAYKPAGLFRGIQTIRQLLPPAVESSTVQPGPWSMATGVIRDYPRFAWRGVMLDVARHFFKVDDVKRYIDLVAYYKMNHFHLHLSDDQGWRIMINAWPKLATIGGSTEVGGGAGGYYTQADYADIVAYAQSRYITVVPEIDMPGHTNAALASYANLNCNGVAPNLYSGINVGFSSLCTSQEVTYTLVSDVVKELVALTPGSYIHIGGDESAATNPDDYVRFVERVEAIVQSYGKQVIGWEEIASGTLQPATIVQHWNQQGTLTQKAVAQGVKVIMSPANKAYLDMKYDSSTALGLHWAGYIEVQDAYDWDPANYIPGVSESDVLGVEAPLWSETLQTLDDIEYMAFPRVLGYAEIGWSPAVGRSWDEYKLRLAAHGPRLTALGVKFYPSALVPWR